MAVTVYAQSFESSTDGTTLTSATTAGGGNAVDKVVTGSATVTHEATNAIVGSLSAQCAAGSGESAYVNATYGGTLGGFFAKYRFAAAPAAETAVHIVRGSSRLLQVKVQADGKVKFENSPGTTTYTTPSALTFPGVYWIDTAYDSGTGAGDGRIKYAVYDSGGSLAGGMSAVGEMTSTDAGAGISAVYMQGGKANASTDTNTYLTDDWRWVTGAYTLAGPGTVPVADAGTDHIDIEPGETVTLDGTGSAAIDGTLSTYAWSQTAGTTVTLSSTSASSPTFTAPAHLTGETLTFSLVVTDSGARDSVADTVDITVLAATARVVQSGAEVAAYMEVAQ